MIKKLLLLIKIIPNLEISFKNPPKKELLIFDSTSISLIKNQYLHILIIMCMKTEAI